MSYYAYMAVCADKTIYSGYTADPKRREAEHNSGHGAKYTRCRLPVKIVYYEECQTKSEAMKREAAFKKLDRLQKLEMIAGFKKEE